jgi:hypothetical protein
LNQAAAEVSLDSPPASGNFVWTNPPGIDSPQAGTRLAAGGPNSIGAEDVLDLFSSRVMFSP